MLSKKQQRYEDMTIFARFKYDKNMPAFRLHVWDLLQECNMVSSTFEKLFDRFYDRLLEIYDEQGFDSEDEELEVDDSSSDNY